jgi:hypothetical protein
LKTSRESGNTGTAVHQHFARFERLTQSLEKLALELWGFI